MNKYLKYYSQKSVSPVRQDIQELDRHIRRRRALFRTLGITTATIKGNRILEVGPGSGYNSIVTAKSAPAEYHLVEPNKTGYDEMTQLFKGYDIPNTSLHLHNMTLEDFQEVGFDIVFCEGLIPGLDKQEEFVRDLASRTSEEGSILVITCIDAISIFFENTRRYLAKKIVDKLELINFEEQVDYLSKVFDEHLKTLGGVTRYTEDWVIDAILNPAAANHDFSFVDTLKILGEEFFYYGSSPDFLTNCVWYKNLPIECQEYNEAYSNQFARMWHNLIHCKIWEQDRPAEDNEILFELCTSFNHSVNDCIFNKVENRDAILGILEEIGKHFIECPTVSKAIDEFVQILNTECYTSEAMMTKYPNYCSSFGRGQQYFSFARR